MDGLDHARIGGGQFFDLHRSRGTVERPDEGVAVAILGGGDGSFGLEDGVDASDAVGDFGGNFKEHVVAHITLGGFGLVLVRRHGEWGRIEARVEVRGKPRSGRG